MNKPSKSRSNDSRKEKVKSKNSERLSKGPSKTNHKKKKPQVETPAHAHAHAHAQTQTLSQANKSAAAERKRADGRFSRPLRELLMLQISSAIDERSWTQKQAADFLGVSQPRISDLARVRVDNFTIDLLVDWLGALGKMVSIETKTSSLSPQLSQRFMVNEDAVPFYTKAITLDPLCTENYIKRADAYFSQNKFELAVGDYTRAIELSPNHPEIRLRRADSYLRLGQDRAALIDCDLVLKQIDSTQNWPQSFYTASDSNMQIQPEAALVEIAWWAHLCKGKALENLEEHEKALASYTNSIDTAPDFAQSYFARASLLEAMNKPDEALADYSKSCQLDPSNLVSHEKMLELQRRLNKREDPPQDNEIALLTAELENASTASGKAHFLRKRAEAYFKCGEYPLANRDFSCALELDSSQSWLWTYIVAGKYKTGDYDGVISDCDQIIANSAGPISINSNEPMMVSGAYMYRGWALEKLERSQSALESYNRGIMSNPKDVSVRWSRAILLEKMGRVNEALFDYRQTLEMSVKLDADNTDKQGQITLSLTETEHRSLLGSHAEDSEPYTPYINSRALDFIWDWLSERSKRVLHYAQEGARGFGQNFLTSDFVLLGLLWEGHGASGKTLSHYGFDFNNCRGTIELFVGIQTSVFPPKSVGKKAPIAQSDPFLATSYKTQQLLEAALEWSESMSYRSVMEEGRRGQIEPEHLLLALLDQTLRSLELESVSKTKGRFSCEEGEKVLSAADLDLHAMRYFLLQQSSR